LDALEARVEAPKENEQNKSQQVQLEEVAEFAAKLAESHELITQLSDRVEEVQKQVDKGSAVEASNRGSRSTTEPAPVKSPKGKTKVSSLVASFETKTVDKVKQSKKKKVTSMRTEKEAKAKRSPWGRRKQGKEGGSSITDNEAESKKRFEKKKEAPYLKKHNSDREWRGSVDLFESMSKGAEKMMTESVSPGEHRRAEADDKDKDKDKDKEKRTAGSNPDDDLYG